ncbi:PadR family transcriptional regulator, partial [Micromonospora sp. ATA51]|uniref:PadR family transcriptional regulator n=1 Tax=Micromonospora sp. ATA51 TaxID=2806098 RepID=UPI001EE3AE36
LVKWMQPVHGYDVRRELLSWSADKWANIQPGSIYHALRKLTEEGLLRAVATEQVGGRPARTTYEITEKGADEFETLLRGLWWQLQEPIDPFTAAFSFLPALPREEAAAALRNRAMLLRAGASRCGRRSTRSGCGPRGRCTSAGSSSSGRPARRPRSPGASGSPSGSSPECRTCLLDWSAGRAGSSGRSGPPIRVTPPRNNQR